MQLGTYRHFKGGLYKVLALVTHSETEQKMVLYHPLEQPESLWVRPLEMFDGEKTLDDKKVKRFSYMPDA